MTYKTKQEINILSVISSLRATKDINDIKSNHHVWITNGKTILIYNGIKVSAWAENLESL